MPLRAVLLILVAAAALFAGAAGGFYLLSDPERVRRTAEESLGKALGVPIRLSGPIGLRFVPRPEAVIMTPRVEAAGDGRLLAGADRIELALSPLDLVTGQEPVTSLTMVRPQLAAPLRPHDLFLLAQGGGVGSIDIVDATLDLQVVPGAPALTLSGMSLERSQDEAGETRVEVAASADGQPLTLSASFRRADSTGGVPSDVTLRLGDEAEATVLSWRGLLAQDRLFGRIGAEARQALPPWLGPLAALPPDRPWQGEARLDVSPAGFSLTELNAVSGEASLAGSLELASASRTGTLRLDLRGAALDALPALASAGLPEPLLGYRVEARITGRDASLNGVALPSLDLTGRIEPEGSIAIGRAAASIAADGAFRMEQGRFLPGPRPMLEGLVSLDLPSARPVLGQLGRLPDWLAPDKPGALLAEGRLSWSPERIELADAVLQSDQSGFEGRLAVAGGRIAADGAVDRLDLDEWFAEPGGWSGLLARLPDGVANLRIGRLSRGQAWIGDVAVEASRDQGRLVIAEASAGSPDDLHLTLAGSIEPEMAALDLVVGLDAPKPARIASILDMELPWLGRLGLLEGTASLRGPADRLGVMLDATSGARQLLVSGILGSGAQAEATMLRVQADAPDLAALLADVALLPVEARALAGPLAAGADLSRGKDGHWLGQVELDAGPLRATGQLGLRFTDGHPRLAGQLALGTLTPESLQALYDTASAALSFAPGSPLRWPGNWPARDLHWGWMFDADLDLSLRRLGTAENGALGRVRLEGGRLDLERLDLTLPSGGRLRGDVALDGTGDVPLLGLSLTLDEIDAGRMGELLGVGRAPRGMLAGEVDLAGRGRSVAAMVGDLIGDVRLAMGPGSIPPATGADAPPFAFSSIEGRFEVERGILRSSPPHLAVDLPDESRRYLEMMLDLPVWFLDATLLPEPDRPGLRLVGPPGRIQLAELSPTDPASAPDGPADRTPPPSEARAPAPTP